MFFLHLINWWENYIVCFIEKRRASDINVLIGKNEVFPRLAAVEKFTNTYRHIEQSCHPAVGQDRKAENLFNFCTKLIFFHRILVHFFWGELLRVSLSLPFLLSFWLNDVKFMKRFLCFSSRLTPLNTRFCTLTDIIFIKICKLTQTDWGDSFVFLFRFPRSQTEFFSLCHHLS